MENKVILPNGFLLIVDDVGWWLAGDQRYYVKVPDSAKAMMRATASSSVTLATGMPKSLTALFMRLPPTVSRFPWHDPARRISSRVPVRARCAPHDLLPVP